MQYFYSGAIKYYTFSSFENQGITHAVFTRHGGYSPSPWHSLNMGSSVGDNIERVSKNRLAALSALGLKPDSVFDLYQVHSNLVVTTERALMPGETHQKADAILTDRPGVTLMMRFADCVPIFLFDYRKRVIGMVHAGWKGTVNQVARNTIFKMIDDYSCNPADIVAAIGPSIGPDHYSVGSDVVEQLGDSIGNQAEQCVQASNGKTFLDLWKANEIILNKSGVNHVEIAGICTHCNLKDWYSHRGENGSTGRFGAVIVLQ